MVGIATQKDKLKVGLIVIYNNPPSKPEIGMVTSWNDRFVFVDYGTGTSRATKYEHIQITSDKLTDN